MSNLKVLLILVDGMRPDSIAECGNSFAKECLEKASHVDLHAQTVFPSITLPCHMSLFHGVTPQKHGIFSNTYVPMAHTVKGLAEAVHDAGKKAAFFYTWEELRDLAKPGSLCESCYATMYDSSCPDPENYVSDEAVKAMNSYAPDFVFLYLGVADETGHNHGWMGAEYLKAINHAWDNIKRVMENLPDTYRVIITADHGGHDFNHGSDDPLDMTIPFLIMGNVEGMDLSRKEDSASILDIAPTVAHWLDVKPEREWEGRSLTS